MRPPENPAEADKWYEDMEVGLARAIDAEDSSAKIERLERLVVKLGFRIEGIEDDRWRSLFERARIELASVPNHGSFIVKPVREMQLKLDYERYDVASRRAYDHVRTDAFQVLGYLKSPEALWILGGSLHDDRDDPESLGFSEKFRSKLVRANSFLAAWAISRMELTESPISEDVLFLNPEEGLDTVRAWWEGVASGETDVSFAGSGIGFRFHPDGSFEEVSMAKRAIVRELPPSPPSEEISSESSFQRLWFVFFGVLAGGAAFVVYKIRYRTRR